MHNMKAIAVDDEMFNLTLIEEMAALVKLDVESFQDPRQAALYAAQNRIDIAFVDYLMPHMDGISFIQYLRTLHPDIPVIIITGQNDRDVKINALEVGANDFLTKPIDTVEFTARVKNMLTLREFQLLMKDKARFLEKEVKEATNNLIKRENETLHVLGKAAEYKDPETANHVSRVAYYSRLLAEKIGLQTLEQDLIFSASALHDVGKIGISDSILLKPGKLTEEEYTIIKTHTSIGYDIIKNSESIFLRKGSEIALTHHERFDGSGYPNGLRQTDIPLSGRIVAIADVFDALTTRRPYKEAWPFTEGLEYLAQNKGTQFDPDLADFFIIARREVEDIFKHFKDDLN